MIKKNLKKVLIITFMIIICAGVGVYAAYLIDATQASYTKSNGTQVTVKAALDELYQKAPKFTRGQLVTYAGEPFYVLYESDTTVTLFAKTNLNQDATAQANAAVGTTSCAFSSSQYWTEAGINLNNVNGYTTTDVMGRVNTYAKTKNAISGRLLTYEEANTLKNSYADMICGRGNTAQTNSSGLGYECYWLGSLDPRVADCVWHVDGSNSFLGDDAFFISGYGLRPVIEVYKSQVTAI